MMNIVLWDTSLQERQERVGIGRSGSAASSISGGGRSSETGLVASYWVSPEARSTGRTRAWGEVGAESSFYGIDAVIDNLRRG